MAQSPQSTAPRRPMRKSRPFTKAAQLSQRQIAQSSQKRGFAQPRVLVEWPEIAGPHVAKMARPVSVDYKQGAMGATLVLLCTGASAPLIEMQKEQLRQKINDIYGYGAIARIKITQTAQTGFAEGQAQFTYATKDRAGHQRADYTMPHNIEPELAQHAKTISAAAHSPALQAALERAAVTFLTSKSN